MRHISLKNKAISIVIVYLFLFNSVSYGIDFTSGVGCKQISKSGLRTPIMTGVKQGLGRLDTAVRGAIGGYINAAEHDRLREWLRKTNARREEYRARKLEDGLYAGYVKRYSSVSVLFRKRLPIDMFGKLSLEDRQGTAKEIYQEAAEGTTKAEIYIVPNMYKETGIAGHWALRDGIIYVDKDIFERYGEAVVNHEIDELIATRKEAIKRKISFQDMVEWLDSGGETEDVRKFLTKIHKGAYDITALGIELVPDDKVMLNRVIAEVSAKIAEDFARVEVQPNSQYEKDLVVLLEIVVNFLETSDNAYDLLSVFQSAFFAKAPKKSERRFLGDRIERAEGLIGFSKHRASQPDRRGDAKYHKDALLVSMTSKIWDLVRVGNTKGGVLAIKYITSILLEQKNIASLSWLLDDNQKNLDFLNAHKPTARFEIERREQIVSILSNAISALQRPVRGAIDFNKISTRIDRCTDWVPNRESTRIDYRTWHVFSFPRGSEEVSVSSALKAEGADDYIISIKFGDIEVGGEIKYRPSPFDRRSLSELIKIDFMYSLLILSRLHAGVSGYDTLDIKTAVEIAANMALHIQSAPSWYMDEKFVAGAQYAASYQRMKQLLGNSDARAVELLLLFLHFFPVGTQAHHSASVALDVPGQGYRSASLLGVSFGTYRIESTIIDMLNWFRAGLNDERLKRILASDSLEMDVMIQPDTRQVAVKFRRAMKAADLMTAGADTATQL